MSGPWVDRPTGPGWWWVREADEQLGESAPVEFDFVDREGDYWSDTLTRWASDEFFAGAQFARAVPPPDWDLVEALDPEDRGRWASWAMDSARVLRLVRAYLAGEPRP